MELIASIEAAQSFLKGDIGLEPSISKRLLEELDHVRDVSDQCAAKGERVVFKLLP